MNERKSVSSFYARFALSAVIIASATSPALASVALTSVFWEFYQGGYAQMDSDSFIESQDHYGGNLPVNVVEGALGGASFQSVATMTLNDWQTGSHFQFSATSTFELSASVEPGWPEGLAHAFGGLSIFFVTFEVTGQPYLFEYDGPEPIYYWGTNEPVSGSILLEPGVHYFEHADPFPGPGFFWQTDWMGPGESDHVLGEVTMNFSFTAIPAPAAAVVFIAMLLSPGTRRRAGHGAG